MTFRALSATLAALLVPAATAAKGGQAGVIWEQTSEMQMAGMAMPPQTSRTCVPASGFDEPPRSSGDDGRCRTEAFKRSGNHITWKVVCSGPDGGSGEGEMTVSGDTYKGRMTISSAGGGGTMKLNGRKIGGACVVGQAIASGAQKQQQEMMAMVQQQQRLQQETMTRELAKECQKAAKNMEVTLFASGGPYGCKDPAVRQAFCDRMGTREGFVKLQSHGAESLGQAATVCRKDPAQIRAGFCATAKREEDLGFLGKYCPRETRELAQRECAGKESSNLPGKYQDFCLTYGKELLAQPKPEEEKDAKSKAKDEGVKALKGLFGR